MTDHATIGEWLKRARLAAGLSLVEATFQLRGVLPEPYWVGISTIHRLESKADVDPVVAVALAGVYGADLETMPEGVLEQARKVRELLIRSTGCFAAAAAA